MARSAADSPNVVVPLACSYDTRGILANTNVVAGYDQRKINLMYDVVKNSVGGNTTLELVKRPGVVAQPGGVAKAHYLISVDPDASTPFTTPLVYNLNGGQARANTTNIAACSGWPRFVDTTEVSGVVNVVVQLYDSSAVLTAYYSPDGTTWTQISDSDFTAVVAMGKMEHLDGFALQMGADNYVYNSDVNSLANWTANNRIKKQIQQDYALGLMKYKTQILSCGEFTTEVMINNGNPSGSPLITLPDREARVGLAYENSSRVTRTSGQTFYSAIVGEKLYFIGRMGGGITSVNVIAYNGQTFEKVSNMAVDRMLGENSFYSVYRFGFLGKVALAIEMTAPTVTSAARWLMFFPDYNEWFEWTSDVFRPANNGAIFTHIGSAGTNLYVFSGPTDTYLDDATAYTATIQFQMPKKSNARDHMKWCGLDADTTAASSNVTVTYCDDDSTGGSGFGGGGAIDLNTQTKRITRQGAYYQRIVKLSHSDNCEFRGRNFLARVE